MHKNIVGVFLVTILFGGCRPSAPSDTKLKRELPGIWQDVEENASAWSNTYQFFGDGHFVFNYSQMDCAKRELSYSGHWKAIESTLQLSIEQRTVLVGGTFEKALGSCASDLELVDGEKKFVDDPAPSNHVLSLAPIEVVTIAQFNYRTGKKEAQQRLRTFIDGKQYWKFEDDPTKYP
jgi:hypothetical protein